MLIATRDDGPHAHAAPYGLAAPPRTLVSRLTSGAQLVGSIVGIPLALAGGYSTYHANFSPEAKCQSLRASIVSVLDKKTDASTLRLLVQRDVVTFERDCGEFDADAAAAFKTLIAADKPPATHRAVAAAKAEKPEKVETVVAAPARPEKIEKAEKVEKREPVKRDIVKRDVVVKETAAKDIPKDAVAKVEPPVQLGAPPQPLVAPSPPTEKIASPAPQPEQTVEQAKPVEQAKTVDQPKPVETAAVAPEKASVDATWVASVREVLRESASQQPAAETTSDVAAPNLAAPNLAAPMSAPINIVPEPQVAREATPERQGEFVPPAEVGPAPRPSAPRPPGLIPNAN